MKKLLIYNFSYYHQIIESELFKCLEEIHGEYYKPFILNKLIPIVGNIYEPNLGMDIITSQQIAQQIDLIIDSAANTTFDERFFFFFFT